MKKDDEILNHIADALDHIDQQLTDLANSKSEPSNPDAPPKDVPEGWSLLSLGYDRKRNIVFMHCHKTDIDPKFLHYLLESQKIPTNAQVVYDRD